MLRVCVFSCLSCEQECHRVFVSVQVCSVLESLEQEYRRDEDWCGSHDKLGMSADTDHLLPLISKHLEQKEAFLKVILITITITHQEAGCCAPTQKHMSKTENSVKTHQQNEAE